MEQLVWAIIIIVFIIFTALKNRARNVPGVVADRVKNAEYEPSKKSDKISRYMEELLGVEIPEATTQIRRKRKKPESFERQVKSEQGTKEQIGKFESPLVNKYEQKAKSTFFEKKNVSNVKFPWGKLSKKDLPKAIVLSEIIGPPISKRKDHRLF